MYLGMKNAAMLYINNILVHFHKHKSFESPFYKN